MKNLSADTEIYVMGGEPSPGLTPGDVENAINEIDTESELAALFAVVENKAWWIEDEEYDFDEGTEEWKSARERTELWFSFADRLRDDIFAILQTEGIEIPSEKQILVLEPFMNRNGIEHRQGWWIKK